LRPPARSCTFGRRALELVGTPKKPRGPSLRQSTSSLSLSLSLSLSGRTTSPLYRLELLLSFKPALFVGCWVCWKKKKEKKKKSHATFFVVQPFQKESLDLVECRNVDGLDVILKGGDLLLEEVGANLVVLNDTDNLEHLDATHDGHELGGTPEEAVLHNAADGLLHRLEVGLVIPRLDVEEDGGLGNQNGLGRLLGLVGGNTLGLDLLSGGISLLIRAEEVNVVLVRGLLLLGGGSSGGGGSGGGGTGLGAVSRAVRVDILLGSGEGVHLVAKGGDVTVPAGSVDVLLGIGLASVGLEDHGISSRLLETKEKGKKEKVRS